MTDRKIIGIKVLFASDMSNSEFLEFQKEFLEDYNHLVKDVELIWRD